MKVHKASSFHLVVGAVAGSVAVLYAASALWQLFTAAPFSLAGRKRLALQQEVFVLMVTLGFKDTSHKEAFLQLWRPLADYVRQQEPGTLSFDLLQSDSKPLELLVFERYVDKDYYINVHKTSAAIAAFKQRLADAPFEVSIQGQSYNELNIGFML